MSFWTEASSEPKRNFRFQVQITGFDANSIIWWAKNFKTPSYNVSESTHDFLDNKYYFPGRLTWDDCTMTLVDPVSPNAAALTNQIILNSGYSVKGQGSAPSTMGKAGAVGAVGSVITTIFNADGDEIEKWTLQNPFLKGVSYSTLDYSNDDLRTIDLTWRYDWAECDHAKETAAFRDQFKVP
tara:strand:- start:984 stop:1532 length:549 start_codon:yes stop_codon:yes gene_type:complete